MGHLCLQHRNGVRLVRFALHDCCGNFTNRVELYGTTRGPRRPGKHTASAQWTLPDTRT